MATLSPNQHYFYYLREAERVGIHQPILAALYQAHSSPSLSDGQTGLGISPENRVTLAQVNTFPQQIQYAANTIRSLTDSLIAQGWLGSDFWDVGQGRYTEQFLQRVAKGYAPGATELTAARLESCNFDTLLTAYLAALETNSKTQEVPQNFAYLEQTLVRFADRIPDYYMGLPHQRDALLEMVRIWRQLDTREDAIAFLMSEQQLAHVNEDESVLDIPLKLFIQEIAAEYSGYPQQREALLRLTQLWRQLGTREDAIASLKISTSPETNLSSIDPTLIAFIQRLPDAYQGRGSQRHALTEVFRLWHQLESRVAALLALGINPEQLERSTTDQTVLVNLATQIDRELLNFVRRLPGEYQESDRQREALIQLVQLWLNLPTRNQTIQFLLEDKKSLGQAASYTKQALPKPIPAMIPKRPDHWTPENIQLFASIVEDGDLIWAEATQGGKWMPPNQAIVDGIVHMAKLAQRARDRIGRPFIITSWYCPSNINYVDGEAIYSRHQMGEAMEFVCEGLTGNQLYWALDPWWAGGLGRYSKFPYLCHIDASNYRIRWLK